jgi:protein dithiol:quinone oxidoreductase
MTTQSFNTAQMWALLICFVSGALLTGALYFEFIRGLAPCPLCMMQRVWFALAAMTAYVSLLHKPRLGIYPLVSLVCASSGGYFSIRQLWLQSLPEERVPACGPDMQYMLDVFPLGDVLVAMTQGTGDCAETAWSFIGVTLPGWALVGFIVLAVLATLQLKTGLKR